MKVTVLWLPLVHSSMNSSSAVLSYGNDVEESVYPEVWSGDLGGQVVLKQHCSLTDYEKFYLLKQSYVLPPSYEFPVPM